MANRISKDKKQLSIVLTLNQIKRLDNLAAELETSRTALISKAVDALLDGGKAPAPVSSDSARIETVIAKLDALAANQAAHTTLLADAIKNQPIAVQQQVLPAPEVTDDDVQEYIRARRPDIALNMWGDPIEPKKKGLIERVFGK